jgi:hypothetical protein
MKGISGVAALLVVALLLVGGWFLFNGGLQFPSGTVVPGGTDRVVGECPETTVYGYAAARNNLNSSLEYQAGSAVYTKSDGKSVIASDTLTGGVSKTYASATIPCTTEIYKGGIYVYALADTARASDKVGPFYFNGGTSITADMIQEDTDQTTLVMYDTTLSNTSSPSTGTKGTPSETTAVAMSAGDSRSGYFDIWQATGKAQYGSHHDGLLWCIDTVDSAAFTDNGISLNSQTAGFSLTPIDCGLYPKATSVDSCNKCYKSRAIVATDSRIRMAWTMTNDGGSDAGASSDPLLYIEDIVYFEDTDGLVKLGTHDSSGTNKGETQVKLTWANS